jgi:hypothetical protein
MEIKLKIVAACRSKKEEFCAKQAVKYEKGKRCLKMSIYYFVLVDF